jgi:hypothetical protein
MKKTIATVIVLHGIMVANAQENNTYNEEVFQISAAIVVVLAVMAFLLTFLKSILEHRLKNKIVDKGVPENVISSILQSSTGEEKHRNIKWFAILAGSGAGLLVVYYTRPLDIHSLAIMAFSISLSFLGYYLFIKHVDKSR